MCEKSCEPNLDQCQFSTCQHLSSFSGGNCEGLCRNGSLSHILETFLKLCLDSKISMSKYQVHIVKALRFGVMYKYKLSLLICESQFFRQGRFLISYSSASLHFNSSLDVKSRKEARNRGESQLEQSYLKFERSDPNFTWKFCYRSRIK